MLSPMSEKKVGTFQYTISYVGLDKMKSCAKLS